MSSQLNGLFLGNPNTQKELQGDNKYALGSMQGWRKTNEDTWQHIEHVHHYSFYAIFDGHNGTDTSQNAAKYLHQYLQEAFEKITSAIDLHHFHQVIKETFVRLDKNLKDLVTDDSGATCIASLIGQKHIYLINLGDSRGIIISKTGQVLLATQDHKPTVRKEKERIEKAGGHISKLPNDVPRVESQLALTRALGDYSIDKHIIPPVPDIIEYPKDSSAAYLILACDGIWDVMTNEQVGSFIVERSSTKSLKDIASDLLDHCLKEQSMDNMTVFIVKLD